MGCIQGAGREQRTQFPRVLDELVTADYLCSVIDAFVEKLSISEPGIALRRLGRDDLATIRAIC